MKKIFLAFFVLNTNNLFADFLRHADESVCKVEYNLSEYQISSLSEEYFLNDVKDNYLETEVSKELLDSLVKIFSCIRLAINQPSTNELLDELITKIELMIEDEREGCHHDDEL